MRKWLEMLLLWGIAHWKAIGTTAGIAGFGGIVRWLLGIRKDWYEAQIAKQRIADSERVKAERRCYERIRAQCEDQAEHRNTFVIPQKPECPDDEEQDIWEAAWTTYWRECSDEFERRFGRRMPKLPSP